MDSLENLFTDTVHQEMAPGIPSTVCPQYWTLNYSSEFRGACAVDWDEASSGKRAGEECSMYRFD